MPVVLEDSEHHFVHRIGWLRAAVLGANDGIVSTASLIVGGHEPCGVIAQVGAGVTDLSPGDRVTT